MEEGVEIEKDKIDDLTGIATKKLKIFMISPRTSLKVGKEYFLNVSMKLKSKEPLLPANSEMAYEQFPLNVIKRSTPLLITTKRQHLVKWEQKSRLGERILQSFLIRK